MKKFLIILLTFFYFGTSSGMVVKLHQCLENITFSVANSDQTCPLCKTKKKKDCCKTQFKVVKTSAAHKAEFLKIDLLKYTALLPKSVYPNPFFKNTSTVLSSVPINAPPGNREVALFISNCNFRI